MLSIQNQKLNCELKYVEVDGEPWFRAKTVATVLGYKNTKQAIRKNVDIEDRDKLSRIGGLWEIPLTYNEKNTVMINESGLYSLILSSKLPAAKKFKRWVTKEVLPSIRKTGEYKMPDAMEERRLKVAEKNARTAELTLWAEIMKTADVKMKTACKDYIMNEITGQKLIKDDTNPWARDITTLCKELFNYMPNHVEKIKLGQLIKKAYVKKFNMNPEKHEIWCNGSMRKVNAYPKNSEKWIIKLLISRGDSIFQ